MAFFECDGCGFRGDVSSKFAGQTVNCPKCLERGLIREHSWFARGFRKSRQIVAKPYRQIALIAFATLLMGAVYVKATRPVVASVSMPLGSQTSVPLADAGDGAGTGVQQIDGVEFPISDFAAEPLDESKLAQRIDDNIPVDIGQSLALPPEKLHRDVEVVAEVGLAFEQAVLPIPAAGPATPKSEPKATARQIAEGKQLFEHQWLRNDHLSAGGDGLGPVFNANSCVECHFQAGPGGSGTNAHNVEAFEVLPAKKGGTVFDGVIHAFANPTRDQESRTKLKQLLGSPMVPALPEKGDIPQNIDAIRSALINTPALWGNGAIDQIDDAALNQLQQQHNLTGRFRLLANGKIGKFGWKSQIASLHEFVAVACAGELGLTNSVRAQQDANRYRQNPDAKPDLTDDQVTSLVSFVAQLPMPRQVIPQDADGTWMVESGHTLFVSIGCANCHVQDVGDVKGIFSDFRLHEVNAPGLLGSIYYTPVRPVYEPPRDYPRLSEWKTPPLWGVADTAPYWHDGTATTLSDAILKHEKEALDVRKKYQELVPEQQQQLLAFLKSLRAPARIE